ncbi:sulfatase [Chthoniobacter flavus Ellin428]|uniref:Sulfatase n=1 Tax=Chthoniobacter flavus Ellin428 TaxID=497964 RepID=B4D360_9BACT|nr:sulfatase [Chthoniobacter flavus]EDY19171.1 sulfatase [Chthoniobacter flavus Ellin428]TCO88017.1 arylsulfatase A-like enzyme [Chthoniobacter flavus]
MKCLLFLLSLIFATTLHAAPSTPPNILFALADDWGYHSGVYGTKWVQTPSFDRVAREGILFTHAYTPSAKCAPSRACIITGRSPWQLKEAANHICYFPQEFKSWGEALTEHGWFVGFTQKGWGPGVAKDANGFPRLLTGVAFNEHKAPPPTKDISNNDYAANFASFLDAAPKGKPWCFWYGSVEPHRGYEYGSGVAKGGKKLSDIDRVPACWPDNETVRNDLLDYAFEVEHFDRHLGRMLAELEKRGLLENTLVIVTSDNGMPFPRSKGNAGEMPNHLPMAVRWAAGIPHPGRTVDDYVSFVDIAPTLMDVAGIDWSATGMAPTVGHSLTDIFHSEKSGLTNPARDHVLIGRERNDIGRPNDEGYPIRGIIKGGYVYLDNFEPTRWPAGNPETGYLDCDGSPTKTTILEAHRLDPTNIFWARCFGTRPAEEFYDLAHDPDCINNLALKPQSTSLQSSLREQLVTELRAQGDPRIFGNGAIFDHYAHSDPAHVGFYERYMKGEKMKTPWVNPTDFEKKDD